VTTASLTYIHSSVRAEATTALLDASQRQRTDGSGRLPGARRGGARTQAVSPARAEDAGVDL